MTSTHQDSCKDIHIEKISYSQRVKLQQNPTDKTPVFSDYFRENSLVDYLLQAFFFLRMISLRIRIKS